MIQFQIGDKAVYPAQGVAEVVGIDEKEISGKVLRFYSLRVLQSDMRILVPIDKAEDVGLRQVLPVEQLAEVYDILRQPGALRDKQTWNRRYRGFIEKLKTGDIHELAEVVHDLGKGQRLLSFSEKRMLSTASNLLVTEVAISKGTSEESVKEELQQLLAA